MNKTPAILTCLLCRDEPATARDTSKERGRFRRRHPVKGGCVQRKQPPLPLPKEVANAIQP